MKLHMAGLIRQFGVDISVWSADSLKGDHTPVDGIPVKKATVTVTPDSLHEPVIPHSTSYDSFSQALMMAAGGSQSDYDLLWVSTHKYPKDSIVHVPSQGGKYRLTDVTDWRDYSDVIIYQLKGDDKNQSNV